MDLLKKWYNRKGRSAGSGGESHGRTSEPSQVMSLNATEPEVEVERPDSSPTNILMTPQGEDAGLEEFAQL